MNEHREIWCCGCDAKVSARLTDGEEIYPHRPDLSDLPFWKCEACGNFVGCHHKTKNRTQPLGVISTPELRAARSHIHRIIDPLWKSGIWDRSALYAEIAGRLGQKDYHTANIRTIDEARTVYRTVREIVREAA